MIACDLPRPSDGDGRNLLAFVQTWEGPGGRLGEMILEPHDGHVHTWWRWGSDWDESMTAEDWGYFIRCVRPVVDDLIEAFQRYEPLDQASAGTLAD